jgi:phosphoribosylanthranilate isomerase
VAKIKICGLFREADLDFANEAGPDFIGFVFAESRRRVTFADAARLRSRLREGIVPVGVFADARPEEIAALYRDGLIGMAQLHGSENAAYIRRLKTLSASEARPPVPVIKTLRMGGAGGDEEEKKKNNHREHREENHGGCFGEEEQKNNNHREHRVHGEGDDGVDGSVMEAADYLLFDSGAGSGKSFDWNLLNTQLTFFGGMAEDLPLGKAGDKGGPDKMFPPVKKSMESGPPSSFCIPWFLAGGIDCGNMAEALALGPFGIDVSSGAETGGVKDREKMIALVERVRRGL